MSSSQETQPYPILEDVEEQLIQEPEQEQQAQVQEEKEEEEEEVVVAPESPVKTKKSRKRDSPSIYHADEEDPTQSIWVGANGGKFRVDGNGKKVYLSSKKKRLRK